MKSSCLYVFLWDLVVVQDTAVDVTSDAEKHGCNNWQLCISASSCFML